MKSAFKALNVDSDHESEDEIDDTKEIQIEEALKLYQTALKLHSEGPAKFAATADAYKALFDSEIFKYQESLSEYKRHELYGDTLVFDTILEDDFDAGPVQPVGAGESAPNTLQQILHLSYKNHGQFMLETMEHWLSQHGHGALLEHEGSAHILGALTHFGDALDKDDADLDLWLRTASVAALLGSQRITRFCLEAVLDGDDELIDSVLRLPGLEQGFAGQQLRELVQKLEDSLSLMQTPLSSMSRKSFSAALKKRLNPFSFAPLPSDVAQSDSLGSDRKPAERIVLNPTKWDWAGVGEVILHHYQAEQSGFVEPPAGAAITIGIPPNAHIAEALPPTASAALFEPEVEYHPLEIPPAASAAEADPDPAKAHQDVVMEDLDHGEHGKRDNGETNEPQVAPVPQSRKRSTDSAGLPETAEGGRSRSKRIRARDSHVVPEGSVGVESAAPDLAKQLEDRLSGFTHADRCLYEIVNDDLERLGITGMGSPEELRALVTSTQSGDPACANIDRAACDLYAALQNGASLLVKTFLSDKPVNLDGISRDAGLNAFLGYAKSGISKACVKPTLANEQLLKFAGAINKGWLTVKEVAFTWLEVLLTPGSLPCPAGSPSSSKSSYMQYRWAEDLKRHLVQIIVNCDDFIYQRLAHRIAKVDSAILKNRALSEDYQLSAWDQAQFEMVESIFEIHLDVYSLIKHPHSGVDADTKTLQKDRLDRWSALARTALQLRSGSSSDSELDELGLRHIWASVFQLSVSDDVQPEHIIFAMKELKAIFQHMDGPVIDVQNNAVMPELSIAAVDRELSQISMKDFFLKVFDQDEKDPVAVIESLEPILEPAQEELSEKINDDDNEEDQIAAASFSTLSQASDKGAQVRVQRPSPSRELSRCLDSALVLLRVSLWQRLREAYEAIEYPPKVVVCYLRIIEALVGEFKVATFNESSASQRQGQVLSSLRTIDEVVMKTLEIIKDDKTAFDCLSYEHLQTTMSALSELIQIMYAANVLQDMIYVQQLPIPRYEGSHQGTFVNVLAKLHDMQLRTWMLQYHLLREGISQNPATFPTPSDNLFEFLRHVHYATGVRGFCHSAGRLFLRLAKDELLRLDDVIDGNTRDTEFAQVLHDLYGLKAFVQPADCQEFGSVPDILDKKTAFQLLPYLLSQARKVDIKDLPKTDLKVSIDKVHGALGRPKPHENISLNRKMLTAYFKSAINPISLYDCLKGNGSLSTKHIDPETAVAASQGWYFLMGNISLSKFRSQKRLTQGPTEDLNFAQAFFLQDLEYSIDRWETWYRLAQANDAQLEECVTWSADKLNANSVELIHHQRAAINCYVMATACAIRNADVAPQTIAKVSEMYTCFANRIYSSSREPFNMLAFNIKDTEHKVYNRHSNQDIYYGPSFTPLSMYTAWKFASTVFKRAIYGKPDKWWNHFMLSKGLWKMYCTNADQVYSGQHGEAKGPTWKEVVAAIVNAINTLPKKKERGREPILEPHYKLASITHKLFQRKEIGYEEGEKILHNTSYAENVPGPTNADDWERYILAVLKALRTADKSSWHHRMIARTAHVVYDDMKNLSAAYSAKHELTQQMFTKTMVVQVWKPENERAGRHFVYTTRYTRFFNQLLFQTDDKTNMEQLAKRVRRKQNDFFEHSKLWTEVCQLYIRLLRQTARVPDGYEDTIFKSLNHEEFTILAARLEAWCQNPETQNSVLDVLRDVIELKKLNNALMKPVLIDDLIGDVYALLYSTIGPKLVPLPSEQPQHAQPPLPSMATATYPGLGPTVASLAQVQVDGTFDPASNTNVPLNRYYHGQVQVAHQPDTTTRSRPKPVGRREIVRRAEAAAVKPTAPTSTTMAIRSPLTNNPYPLNGIPSPTKAAHTNTHTTESSPTISHAVVRRPQIPASAVGLGRAGSLSANVSAPHSVHDDADDESELSELDESEVREIQEEVENARACARAQAQASARQAEPPVLFPWTESGREEVLREHVNGSLGNDRMEGLEDVD